MSENNTVSKIQLAGSNTIYDIADERLREGSFNYEEQNFITTENFMTISPLALPLPITILEPLDGSIFYTSAINLFPNFSKGTTANNCSINIQQNTAKNCYTLIIKNNKPEDKTISKKQGVNISPDNQLPFLSNHSIFYIKDTAGEKINYEVRPKEAVTNLGTISIGNEQYIKYEVTNLKKDQNIYIVVYLNEEKDITVPKQGGEYTIDFHPGIYLNIDVLNNHQNYELPGEVKTINADTNHILVKQDIYLFNPKQISYQYNYYTEKANKLPQYEVLSQHSYAVGLDINNDDNSQYLNHRSYNINLDGKEYIIKNTLELSSVLSNGTLVYKGPSNTPVISMLEGGGLKDINIRIECANTKTPLEEFRCTSISKAEEEAAKDNPSIIYETKVSLKNPITGSMIYDLPVYRRAMPSAFNSNVIEYNWINADDRMYSKTILENVCITNEDEYHYGNIPLELSGTSKLDYYYGDPLYSDEEKKELAGFITYIPPQSTILRFKLKPWHVVQQNIQGLSFKGRAEYGIVIELHSTNESQTATFNTSLWERINFTSVNCALLTTTVCNGINTELDSNGILCLPDKEGNLTPIDGGLSATPSVSLFTNQHTAMNPVISKPFMDLRKNTHIQGTQIIAWDYYDHKTANDRVYTLGADNCLILTDYCYFPGNNPKNLYYSLHRTSTGDYYTKTSNILLHPQDVASSPLRQLDKKNSGKPIANFIKINSQDTTDLNYFAKGLQLSQGWDLDTVGLHTMQFLHSPQRSQTTGMNFGVYQVRRWVPTNSSAGEGYWTSTMINLEPTTIRDVAKNNQLDQTDLGQKLCENHYYYTNSNFIKTTVKSGFNDLVARLSDPELNNPEQSTYNTKRPYQYILTCKSVIQGEEAEGTDNSGNPYTYTPYKFLFSILNEDTSIDSFSPVVEKHFYLSGNKQIIEETDDNGTVKKYIVFNNIQFTFPSTI